MHPIDTIYTNICNNIQESYVDGRKPPKCKVKNIYDETLSRFIIVGKHLQTLSDRASQYAATYCYLKAYDIIHEYCEQTTYIKNYDFFYDANFYDLICAGQLMMCESFYKSPLFSRRETISPSYSEEFYEKEVDNMLDFLYSTKLTDSVSILAEMYVLWEFQFIINVRELTSKYTVSDYIRVAQELLYINITSLELRDCCTRLKFMVDEYVRQNNLSYSEVLNNDEQDFPKLLKRYKTCRAIRIVLCYDDDNNITGIYSYIDKFGKIHFNRVPIVFIHSVDMFGTYTAKISDQYQLTFRVFDNSIHFYKQNMNNCYNNCNNCLGVLMFIEIKVLKTPVNVYIHDLPQELCTSLIDHSIKKLCTVDSSKSTILLSDKNEQYKNVPIEEVNTMELWHKFNQ